MNFIVKMALPFVKSFIIKQIQDEAFQKNLVKQISDKVDFPKVTKEEEQKFVNSVYDATQALLIDFVKNM